MTISIIIPTFNEAATIGKLINYLKQHSDHSIADIIVSDGGSEDNTIELASKAGAHAVVSPAKGRAAQMNYGASIAGGEVFYFVHADCFPPETFAQDIKEALGQGYRIGRYFTKFDSPRHILKINAWFTRFDFFICMGGDQTLFVSKSLFQQCKGFKENMQIMEEYEFCRRARKRAKYKIMKGAVLVSARKYDTNTWLKVQLANLKVVRMFKKGASQQEMVQKYQNMLHYRKNAF
jgi:rSAM/selenodomain-associated transferase 2